MIKTNKKIKKNISMNKSMKKSKKIKVTNQYIIIKIIKAVMVC